MDRETRGNELIIKAYKWEGIKGAKKMLESIKDIGVSNWIGLVSIVVAIFIGVKSIKFAKGALEHSQRSLIVNESYKPIINDINNYRNLKPFSSQPLDFSGIKAVKMDIYLMHLRKIGNRK